MSNITQAIRMINSGGVVAYPTESFFALGAAATNANAVKKVFRLKGREGKPIALIAGSVTQVEKFFMVSVAERRLMKKYWPGAVTILLTPRHTLAADALFSTTPSRRAPRSGHPSSKRRGRVGIGVRVPAHAGARRLALSLGCPITATSANISGKKPTKLRTVVTRTFRGIVTVNGACGAARKPSTILSMDNGKINILRRGAVRV